jgi:hypothetical protein
MANINFTCTHCSFSKQLPASAEGMQGNCPSCSSVVTINANVPINPFVSPQQPLPQQPLPQQPLPQQPLPQQTSQATKRPSNRNSPVLAASAIGIVILLIAVSLFVFLGGNGNINNDRTNEVALYQEVRDNNVQPQPHPEPLSDPGPSIEDPSPMHDVRLTVSKRQSAMIERATEALKGHPICFGADEALLKKTATGAVWQNTLNAFAAIQAGKTHQMVEIGVTSAEYDKVNDECIITVKVIASALTEVSGVLAQRKKEETFTLRTDTSEELNIYRLQHFQKETILDLTNKRTLEDDAGSERDIPTKLDEGLQLVWLKYLFTGA